ncbi:hypothetical protein [Bacillus sp. BF9-10]|uniref:hypothetical protein n=1 Tax=Bacillus sp. BF9-10 TaxID=2217822 RepID=UPI0011CB5800|nr:hypothetical protein [Bacillus sp. BF9-10]TXR78305.1 hypothetical protein DN396_19750 [Bacillus sp. BF9-10]
MVNRSEHGIKIQLDECLKIISSNLELAKGDKAFTKVLAGQLRLLLCDTNLGAENSLINKIKQNPSLDCISNQFVSYKNTRLIEFISPESLFKQNSSQLPLERWLSQKVIKSNISYESLENCHCSYCGTFDASIRDIRIEEDKCFIAVMCNVCAATFSVNLNSISNAYEGKIENVKRITITIRDIIKNYANKNGGAHVDSVLDIKGLLIAELGDKYIQAISQYILEYFSETKI